MKDYISDCLKTTQSNEKDKDDVVEACTESAKELFCPTEPAFLHCPSIDSMLCTPAVPCRDATAPDELEACKTHRNISYDEFNSK